MENAPPRLLRTLSMASLAAMVGGPFPLPPGVVRAVLEELKFRRAEKEPAPGNSGAGGSGLEAVMPGRGS